MVEIQLFSIKGEVKEVVGHSVTFEKELQHLIEENMEQFFGVTFLKSEYVITEGRMDSIGLDENNSPVIFEYKRSVNENVINQGLFYLDWLLDHKADFQLLVLEKLGKEKANNIDWSIPSVVCIANDFTKYDEHAVNQMQRSIKLVKYKKYEDFILFEHVNAPKAKSIVYDEVRKNTHNVHKDLQEMYEDVDEKIRLLYETIKDYIMSLGDDVTENELKRYVAFKKIRNFVCMDIGQSRIRVHLKLDPNTVELEEGFIKDVSGLGHLGTGDVQIHVKNMEDFNKIKYLIDRSYQKNV